MFKEVSGKDVNNDFNLLNAISPKGEYYVIKYDNGNTGWIDSETFEKEYQIK